MTDIEKMTDTELLDEAVHWDVSPHLVRNIIKEMAVRLEAANARIKRLSRTPYEKQCDDMCEAQNKWGR